MQQHKDTEATELYVDKRTLERYKTEETNDKDQVALCCMLAVVRAVGSLAHLGYLAVYCQCCGIVTTNIASYSSFIYAKIKPVNRKRTGNP